MRTRLTGNMKIVGCECRWSSDAFESISGDTISLVKCVSTVGVVYTPKFFHNFTHGKCNLPPPATSANSWRQNSSLLSRVMRNFLFSPGSQVYPQLLWLKLGGRDYLLCRQTCYKFYNCDHESLWNHATTGGIQFWPLGGIKRPFCPAILPSSPTLFFLLYCYSGQPRDTLMDPVSCRRSQLLRTPIPLTLITLHAVAAVRHFCWISDKKKKYTRAPIEGLGA